MKQDYELCGSVKIWVYRTHTINGLLILILLFFEEIRNGGLFGSNWSACLIPGKFSYYKNYLPEERKRAYLKCFLEIGILTNFDISTN